MGPPSHRRIAAGEDDYHPTVGTQVFTREGRPIVHHPTEGDPMSPEAAPANAQIESAVQELLREYVAAKRGVA